MGADGEIRFLGGTSYGDIHAAMLEAFADYPLDMSYMTEQVLRCRAIKNGVDLSISPGVFVDGRLAGLTLVGLGTWVGESAAFDACTGIVKVQRGRGLAGRLFEAALPELRRRGIKRFLLEVLQENEAAIRAYEKTGFHIVRPFTCFLAAGSLPAIAAPVDIRPVGLDLLPAFESELDWPPSWENSFAALRAIPDQVRIFGAFAGGACQGIVAYYPTLRWIMTLVVKRASRGRGLGRALLARAVAAAEAGERPVRVNNVDPGDAASLAVLKACGFEAFTSQYEMAFEIR